jgi:peptide chain release factor 2
MILPEELKNELVRLRADVDELKSVFKIQELEKEIEEISELINKEGFWNDLDTSQKVMQRQKNIQNVIDKHKKLSTELEDLIAYIELSIEEDDESSFDEIKQDTTAFKKKLEEIKLSTLLTGEYDNSNAILSLHSGAGGTEAMDWVEMLYRMYNRWAERHNFKITLLDYLDGEEAGLKSVSIFVEGVNAYGFLKSESGIHRLIRISPFDSGGRRHTSFAAVEVMPEIDDKIVIEIRDEDLKVDTYRSSGAGGQHINKTESAIRITHIPTGIVVSCQTQRSQHQNRDFAMKMLKSKLIEIKEREHLDKISDIKGNQAQIAWGSQIRSYTFMPYQQVKDHRTDFENGNINAVMDGDLDGFINAYLKGL